MTPPHDGACQYLTVRRTLPQLLAAVIVTATLAACSADRPEIEPGTCLAKETSVDGTQAPDLASAVPCTSPHRFEVYDVIAVPDRRDLAERAQQRCTSSLLRVTGYDALKVNGKTAAEIGLIPALRGIEAPKYAVMPRTPLVADRRQVVCTARTKVPVQAGGGGGLLLSVAKTSAFPVAFRPCRAYEADRRTIADVPCSSRHVSELLFLFDAEKALGRKFVAGIVRDPTAERFDQLDRVCTKALPQLLGKGFDKGLRGFGSVARQWTDTSKPVRCDVGPIEFETTDLPPGSLVGTNGIDVKLKPIQNELPDPA